MAKQKPSDTEYTPGFPTNPSSVPGLQLPTFYTKLHAANCLQSSPVGSSTLSHATAAKAAAQQRTDNNVPYLVGVVAVAVVAQSQPNPLACARAQNNQTRAQR